MMWLFDPRVAEIRKEYDVLVKIKVLDGDASAGRRTASVMKTEEPQSLSQLTVHAPAQVTIEYTDKKGRNKTVDIEARALDIQDPKNGCELVVIKGEHMGRIVRHAKTQGDKVRVHLTNGNEKKTVTLQKANVCPVKK